ncbi:MAG: hypothetical protein ACI8T1_001612 [Verrucomicrobiales bacterium]|jgi:hypothetical protein
MNIKSSHFLTTASCLLLSSCWLQAQGEGSRRRPTIPLTQALDLDKNGELSASELEKASGSLLTLDKDGDGQLSSEEVRPQRRQAPPGNARRGGGGPRPTDIAPSSLDLGEPGIAWYGRLDLALQEAKRSNRPILFMAAASQCNGVPGVF